MRGGERIDDANQSAAAEGLEPWPEDKPFPLTAQECLALCRGDLVNPGMTAREAADTFTFRFEMSKGWIFLKRE